ncbi:protein artichoke [Tribolium castaneum]|uniref:Tartan/capricious-like protein n=1 Tax=Tribolium castaneum TaxID=7070 RepID=D6X4B6_TRICA|nr:PREDICTED: probable leucine-rich repeat receptor-like protein kinase At1g35710 [Tribolium castaneum]EEZ97737.1 tartan/capricious-like protein [Tribolium castaneum]|eukprot:XP_008198761.1 PREDICTED: probable leucine-rich repeat receptor-like protein kinase At1g35710 [Tribolium castaneum]
MKLFWLVTLPFALATPSFIPCSEISRDLRFPCTCSLGPPEPALDNNPAISVNCDRVVFPGDLPALPFGAPIVSFRQRWAGHQALPTQIFSSTGLPLRSIDLSGNSLRRLTERLLQALQPTLVELRLSDNLLGDTLNPIFSTSEFRGLNHLQVLDLSGNIIRALEEGIFEGCDNLQELYLERNSLTSVPSTSLNGPKSLKMLSLASNRITSLKSAAFEAQPNLETVDLTLNGIGGIEGGALSGLKNLKTLKLGHNKLTRFNSDVFQGASNLKNLDLSENFITEFPTIALRAFKDLKYLNLSSNLVQSLDNNDLLNLVGLYYLDLSRNNIANIAPGTFLGLKQLRKLDISVNSLRTIEDDAFEGLDNLEHLNLKDNNILLIPASALGRLPKLSSLQLDYNRVAALSGDILRSIAEKVTSLVLAKNVIRELPPASFQHFQHLSHLDLTRNLLTTLNSDAFVGLETTLKELHLPQNKISTITGPTLSLLKLETLDLSDNHLTELSRNVFGMLPQLRFLNLSHNSHLASIPSNLLHKLPNLEVFDLSYTGLRILTGDFFAKSSKLRRVYLHNNAISELGDGVFANLPNLTSIDLSSNHINNIKQGAFVNIMNLKELVLRGNQLSSFKGEFFNTGTSLELLDISHNQLSYLFPSSFRIHPRLKILKASNNKFNFFPAELIATLQFLQVVDLSHNDLKTVEELDFARLPRLRVLLLRNNKLEFVSEMAFHNSTQLQVIDLSYNKLERLAERIFEGLVRLELLNLEGNLLSDLPETIFERARLQMLENINLRGNLFEVAPLKSLQRQYFFVSSVDLSRNKLREIPGDDSSMVNIKKLDLSFNPLSDETIRNVLGEPKTMRELNLAGTGIRELTQLETPFLSYLNLSYNNITSLNATIFERTSLLEVLDVSNNQISDISNYSNLWPLLKNLQTLDLSSNPIRSISSSDFNGLTSLKQLSITSLLQCEKIEKGAFKSLKNLSILKAFEFPKLGYIDLKGLLSHLPSLEHVTIETKDAAVGADQLQPLLQPRLKTLKLKGGRLRSLSSGTLSGIKGGEVTIGIMNTSITSLPPSLFFPVPRSSKITLDVTGNHITTLTPQILATLDDRRGDLKIVGLETNPIVCDCGARALRRWLPSHMTSLRCSAPDHLHGRLLVEIADDDLTCDARKVTTPTSPLPRSASSTRLHTKVTEPEIIWSVPVTEMVKTPKPVTSSNLNNDDTLIIGIVGGVVAFIAILIIIICIIRLRMGGSQYRGGPPVVGPLAGSSCACSVKGAPVYTMGPGYGPGYAATLPHKMQAPIRASNYSTMGRVPYYGNSGQPYFIALPPDENKIYR